MQSRKIFRAYRNNRCTQSALSGDGHIVKFKLLRCPKLVDFDVCDNQNVMNKW